MTPLSRALLRRVLLNGIPALVVLGVVGMTMFGEEGVFRRHVLKRRLYATQARVVQLQVDNLIMQREIARLRDDPIAVRRVAAERLLVAEAGSTIYRFASEP